MGDLMKATESLKSILQGHGFKFESPPEKHLNFLYNILVDRKISDNFKLIYRHFNELFLDGGSEMTTSGFLSTALYLKSLDDLINHRSGDIDRFLETSFHCVNLVQIGTYSEKHDLLIFLSGDTENDEDVILMEPHSSSSYKLKKNGAVISNSLGRFFERINFCASEDIPVNLLYPSSSEVDFMRAIGDHVPKLDQSGMVELTPIFSRKLIPEKWQVVDEDSVSVKLARNTKWVLNLDQQGDFVEMPNELEQGVVEVLTEFLTLARKDGMFPNGEIVAMDFSCNPALGQFHLAVLDAESAKDLPQPLLSAPVFWDHIFYSDAYDSNSIAELGNSLRYHFYEQAFSDSFEPFVDQINSFCQKAIGSTEVESLLEDLPKSAEFCFTAVDPNSDFSDAARAWEKMVLSA